MRVNRFNKVNYNDFNFIVDIFDLGFIKCTYREQERLEFANQPAASLLGYTLEEYYRVFADSPLGFICAEDLPKLRDSVQQLVADKHSTACLKVRANTAAGDTILLAMTVLIMGSADTYAVIYIVSLCSTSFDVLDRYYGDIFTKNIVGNLLVCNFTEDMQIIYVSENFANMMGCEGQDILGTAYTDLVVGGPNKQILSEICQQCATSNYSAQERVLQIGDEQICFMEQGGIVCLDSGQKLIKIWLTDISQLKKTEESLRISETGYELALSFSDVALFEYDVRTGDMNVHKIDNEQYAIPTVIKNAPQYLVDSGIVMPRSVDTFLDMYKQIHEGASIARRQIWTLDASGNEHMLEVQLANIFDSNGMPIRAIGMHKDITESVLLKREQEYNKGLSADLLFIYEANISTNELLSCNDSWLQRLDIGGRSSFTEFVQELCDKIVDSEHQAIFMDKLSMDSLISSYMQGDKVVSVEFASCDGQDKRWYSQSVNIIYNDTNSEYMIRCYLTDITEDKSKEQRVLSEQVFYESMLAKSVAVYEVNITKNRIEDNNEPDNKFAIKADSNNYNIVLWSFAEENIYKADREGFLKAFERKNVLAEFKLGKQVYDYEYRVKIKSGGFKWLRSTLHLLADTKSFGDIRGFSYMEDINEEKCKELDLLYKSQHDLLTGFYNKLTVKERVTEYLQSDEGHCGKHAFFIVDLDNFKNINDNFGHAFGDAVISKVAAKIKSIFREDDILGRIGGDEFAILMKNIGKQNMVYAKARKLCDLLCENYSKQDSKHHISASVGVAYYSVHGNNYDELYHTADIAMYNSKEYGRNRFSVYETSMRVCQIDQPRENMAIARGRRFEEYVCEYVIRILYDSKDELVAINSVLELLGKHYGFCRVYIFEDYEHNSYTTNTFEWCAKSVEPQMFRLQNLSYEEMGDLRHRFNAEGVMLVNDISRESESVQSTMHTYGIKSMLAIKMKKDDDSIGFIGFDNCNGKTMLEAEQIWDLSNIANILGMFIAQMRSQNKSSWSNNIALAVLENINAHICVCNPDNYELLYANKSMHSLVEQVKPGDLCYEKLWGLTEPCTKCMMRELLASGKEHITRNQYNSKLGIWVKTDVSWIELAEYGRVCLISNTDISEYKI